LQNYLGALVLFWRSFLALPPDQSSRAPSERACVLLDVEARWRTGRLDVGGGAAATAFVERPPRISRALANVYFCWVTDRLLARSSKTGRRASIQTVFAD
jgi:hypothetical protein